VNTGPLAFKVLKGETVHNCCSYPSYFVSKSLKCAEGKEEEEKGEN
jgi:hypothetical protein